MKTIVIVAQASDQISPDHPDFDSIGTYEVKLRDDTPVDAIASTSLDALSSNFPLSLPEDFQVTVHDPESGTAIDEPLDSDSYAGESFCLDIEFAGSLIDPKYE
jgi:hypothetical protein